LYLRRQAQACYCGAHNCTGYIGSKEGFSDDDEPDENQSQYSDSAFTDDENSALPIFSRKLPPSEHKKKLFSLGKKHSTPRKKKSDAELKLETETKEIDALASKGTLRNRDQVLEFNRYDKFKGVIKNFSEFN
jgi:hypothetical protein